MEANRTHCVGVYLFNRISVTTLVNSLLAKSIIDPSETRRMVQAKLSIGDSDFLIETSTLKVALVCPLMKCRMQLPARARNCKHVQCFDLQPYLLMNEKKPSWQCPVCDGHAPYEALIIDGLFKSIIEKVTDVDEIEFTADGEWTKVAKNNDKSDKKLTSSSSKTTLATSSSNLVTPSKAVEEICCDDGSPNTSGSASNVTNTTTMPTSLFNGHSSNLFLSHFLLITLN